MVFEGVSDKVQKLGTEKKAFQDELAAASVKIRTLIAKMAAENLELTTGRSKAEENSGTIFHLEGLKGFEGRASSAEERGKVHGQIEGLRTGS